MFFSKHYTRIYPIECNSFFAQFSAPVLLSVSPLCFTVVSSAINDNNAELLTMMTTMMTITYNTLTKDEISLHYAFPFFSLFRPPGPALAGRGGLYILLLCFFCPYL